MDSGTRRILYVWGDVAGIGGTERRMAEVAAELSARGHVVHSHARSASGDSRLQNLMRASGTTTSNSSGWLGLRAAWRKFAPDTVIAFGLKPSLATRLFRVFGARTELLLMARNGLDFLWKPWMHRADRVTSGLVDVYFANSRKVAEHLVRKGISPKRVSVIDSALDSEWTAPTVARSGRHIVGMVGNQRAEKNHLFGVDVFLNAQVDARLRIYTDDGSQIRAHLAAMASQARSHDVEVVENRTVRPRDLDEIDVLLHPSLSESLPRTVLEATARGCGIVASDVGDTRLHVDGETGVAISGWDLADYVTALDAALLRPRHGGGASHIHVRTTTEYVDDLLALSARRGSGAGR